MQRPRISIRYSRRTDENTPLIAALENEFEREGFAVGRDAQLKAGERWRGTLDRWLDSSHGGFKILTPAALDSESVPPGNSQGRPN